MNPGPTSEPGDVAVRVLLGSFDPDADPPDPVHLLVRRFRAGERVATRAVVGVATALPDLMDDLGSGRAVPIAVPGHDGTISVGMRALMTALGAAAGRPAAGHPVLARHVAIPEVKVHGARDPSAELASLRWLSGGGMRGIDRVVLLDDVLVSGGTLRACVAAMRRDGWRGEVTALVLARAIPTH